MLRPTFLQRFVTPKDRYEALDTAVSCSQLALSGDPTEGICKIYYSLNPENDIAICRRASDRVNDGFYQAMLSNLITGSIKSDDSVEGQTSVVIRQQTLWMPTSTANDPQYKQSLKRVTSGIRPYLLEGIKNFLTVDTVCADEDPCPFHKRFGQANATFVSCCKTKYLKKMSKAKDTGRHMQAALLYEPVDHSDANAMLSGTLTLTPAQRGELNQLGYWDVAGVEITVPANMVAVVKERMDNSTLCHAVFEYSWLYLGFAPLEILLQGVMIFGELSLDPKTGIFRGEAQTAGSLEHLIRQMKHICFGMRVMSATLEARPFYKMKPDKEALGRNHALLKDGWNEVDVELIVDKETNAPIGRSCGFCHESENEKLSRCACKSTFYCSKDCQLNHWRDHKKACKILRGEKK